MEASADIQYLFVTGMPRSGTTLLARLVSRAAGAEIHLQPLPLLFINIKREFVRTIAPSEPEPAYPVGDMFGSGYYPVDAFLRFLGEFHVDDLFWDRTSAQLAEYSGWGDRLPSSETVPTGLALAEFLRRYWCRLGREADAGLVGSKEIICEEFIPFMLASKIKVLHIIRDPRDMITSMNFGSGLKYAGLPKPDLFNIRQWRKGVAFALANSAHPDYMFLRYEDLTARPKETLKRMMGFLPGTKTAAEPIEKQIGNWSAALPANSSHGALTGISSASVGRFQEYLDVTRSRFIEACCFPEMAAMDYGMEISSGEVSAILQGYRERGSLHRSELSSHLWSTKKMQEEIERFKALATNRYKADLFIFPASFDALRRYPNPGKAN